MPPRLPDESIEVSDAEISDALAAIDQSILEQLQLRAAWLARSSAAKPAEDSDATAGSVTDLASQATQRITDVLATAKATRVQYHAALSEQREFDTRTATESVFRDIDALCRGQLAPVKVAFLGPLGTYTHDAANHQFGAAMQAIPVDSFAEIFAAVENGSVDYGVAPIENSTEGAVNQTHDLLVTSQLHICGEVRLRIRHCLMSQCESPSDIRAVHAHPQSLAQCRDWLNAQLPGVELVSEPSNAAAAQLAKQADANSGVAAIASESAADRYGLHLMAKGIEDTANNTTRFIVLGRHQPAPTGDDATSLLISAPNKPGGLRRMLQPFEDAGVSMTRIESRPARTQMWDYVFFIDVSGHCQDEHFANVLQQLKEETPLVRVLGSYPRAKV